MAALGTAFSLAVILSFAAYLVLSVRSALQGEERQYPEIFEDEERGVWCYYIGEQMECFAVEEDKDDSVPEDERYEQAGTIPATT